MSGELRTEGLTIAIGDQASPEVFNTIINVMSISSNGLGGARSDIDVTNLSSTAREYLTGLPDIEEVTFTINQVTTDTYHTLLETLHGTGASRNYRITLPSSPAVQYNFTATVKNVSPSYEVDDVVKQDVTLRPTARGTRA